MSRKYEILRIAAEVWDKEDQTPADLRFLEDLTTIDRWCSRELSQSNILFGAASDQHKRTLNAVSNIREQRYVEALSRYQVGEVSWSEAAE
jgi:hypothetical protein